MFLLSKSHIAKDAFLHRHLCLLSFYFVWGQRMLLQALQAGTAFRHAQPVMNKKEAQGDVPKASFI